MIKNFFRGLFRRLPRTQILIGATIALASYAVTNWWKADVLDEIKHYSDAIQTSNDLDGKLLNLAMFVTISDQLDKMLHKQSKEDKQENNYFIIQSFNLLISRERQQLLIGDFINTFPSDILETKIKPGNVNMDPAKQLNSSNETIKCILFDVYANGADGAHYSTRLAEIYKIEAEKMTDIEKYPLTLRDALTKDLQRLWIGNSSWSAFTQQSKIAGEPFSGISDVDNRSRTIWAQNCLLSTADKTFDHFSVLLRGMRPSIHEKFIAPLEAKMGRIELLEKILYAAGALIALFGTKPEPVETANPEPQ